MPNLEISTDTLRRAASAIRTPEEWSASERANVAQALDVAARQREEADERVELIADTLRYCLAHCDSENETDLVEWVAEKFGERMPTVAEAARLGAAIRASR